MSYNLFLHITLGILPLLGVRRGWLSSTETGQSHLVAWSLSTGICFGGGVILTSCLTHMLPDVNEVGRVIVSNSSELLQNSDYSIFLRYICPT